MTRHNNSLPKLTPAELPSMARVRARQARALVPTEHAIQVAFIAACRMLQTQYPELALLFAVPNGGYRSKKTAALLQQEGCLAGVPDLILPVPRGRYCGFALEFKRPGSGRLSPAQLAYFPKLAAQGWRVCVHTDAGEALAEALLYLRGDSR